MFDQLGGLERIVRNKTVAIKVNLTGSPTSAWATCRWKIRTTRIRA